MGLQGETCFLSAGAPFESLTALGEIEGVARPTRTWEGELFNQERAAGRAERQGLPVDERARLPVPQPERHRRAERCFFG